MSEVLMKVRNTLLDRLSLYIDRATTLGGTRSIPVYVAIDGESVSARISVMAKAVDPKNVEVIDELKFIDRLPRAIKHRFEDDGIEEIMQMLKSAAGEEIKYVACERAVYFISEKISAVFVDNIDTAE